MGIALGLFTLVGKLQLGQMSFGPLPSLPSNPPQRLHLGVPLNVEVSSAWQAYDVVSRMHLTLYFPKNMVCRQSTICRQTHRHTYASQMLVSPVSPSKPKFWYLHGSQFWVVLVPCLSEAGQSGLLWGVPPAVLGVTIPDDPASAGTLSTDGAGVREVVFPTLAMGLSISPCSMLELMGSR